MDSKKYRLYIDESGTHDYNKSDEIRKRYLCLLGVIISKEHNENYFTPKWEELRSIFTRDADFPAVFHYVDVISRQNEFGKLSEESVRGTFNSKYLEVLTNGDYVICCVVLDKKTHLENYGASAMHPYHYCLNVLLERYVNFLLDKDGHGDVLAEARGKDPDKLLKGEFSKFYENGTFFLKSESVQKRLTSRELKLKTKEARIPGLELADMLATAMKYLALKKYGVVEELNDNFTKTVLETIFCKVRKNPYLSGFKVKGYGIKLIQ